MVTEFKFCRFLKAKNVFFAGPECWQAHAVIEGLSHADFLLNFPATGLFVAGKGD